MPPGSARTDGTGCRRRSATGALALRLRNAALSLLLSALAVVGSCSEEMQFERTPERLARGEYLANAVTNCVLCHSERDWSAPGAPPVAGRELAGSILREENGHRMVAPNLTPDMETGAGSWTDAVLARAIREGVGHDGRNLSGPMWWWSFRSLSDEDVASLVVYLRSVPAIHNPLPPRRIPPEFEQQLAEEVWPLDGPVPQSDLTDPFQRGKYLIEIADCAGCHSAGEGSRNPGLFGGGNQVTETLHTANLTPDPSGIGGWNEEVFVQVMRTGRGGALSPSMPWATHRHMTDEDLRAIYRALQSVPPVRHWVNNAAPPTPCLACGQRHGLGETNGELIFEPADVNLGPLSDYEGTYRLGTEEITISARDGALFVSLDGEDVRLLPAKGGYLRGAGLDGPISFERNGTGTVHCLVEHLVGPSRWEKTR